MATGRLRRLRRRPGTLSPSASPAATGPSTPATATTAACSSRVQLGRRRRHAVRRPRRPGLQGPADRRRREAPRRPGPGCLAGLRPGLPAPPTTAARATARPATRATRAAQRLRRDLHPLHRQPVGLPRRSARPRRRPSPPRPARRSRRVTASTRCQAGDTLSKIAEAKDVKGGWEKLFKLNDDIVDDADLIFPGQQLHLKRTPAPAGRSLPPDPGPGRRRHPRALAPCPP